MAVRPEELKTVGVVDGYLKAVDWYLRGVVAVRFARELLIVADPKRGSIRLITVVADDAPLADLGDPAMIRLNQLQEDLRQIIPSQLPSNICTVTEAEAVRLAPLLQAQGMTTFSPFSVDTYRQTSGVRRFMQGV